MLDFSQRNELGLHAGVIAAVQAVASAMTVRPLIVGAFARDLHLVYAYSVPVQRQTEDIDLALAVEDWTTFERVRMALLASGTFAETKSYHRLRHGALPIDLVPFGTLETTYRTIVWPPEGETVMDVFGFREAQQTAIDVLLPNDVQTKVVTLPALALLKLVCWQDRHLRSPKKDASDLQLIVANYLHAGNESRLWAEFVALTQENDFGYDAAGAHILGHDIAALLDSDGRVRVSALLGAQSNGEAIGRLPIEMDPMRPERAARLLATMREGLTKASS